MKLYYTVKETAEIFRCSSQTISRRISEGIIPTHPDDKGLIPKQYVEEWDIDHDRETFQERKLREKNEALQNEIQELKKKFREILKIGMGVEI